MLSREGWEGPGEVNECLGRGRGERLDAEAWTGRTVQGQVTGRLGRKGPRQCHRPPGHVQGGSELGEATASVNWGGGGVAKAGISGVKGWAGGEGMEQEGPTHPPRRRATEQAPGRSKGAATWLSGGHVTKGKDLPCSY